MTPREWLASQRGRAVVLRVALVGVVAALVGLLVPALPSDQRLVFVVDDPAVTRLDATWTAHGEADPRGGVSLHFDRPTPRRVRHVANLPNGEYDFVVELGRGPSVPKTTVARRVRLEGEEATIRVHGDRSAVGSAPANPP